MNSPKYPFYIVSKGRWETRLTSKALDRMGVFHYMVVEEQEYDSYCSVMPKEQVLILDTQYQIDVFESLREKLYRELERKEAEASQECRIVNTYLYKK